MEDLFILVLTILVEVDRIQTIVDSIRDQLTNSPLLLRQLHNVAFVIMLQLEIDAHQHSHRRVVVVKLLVEINQFQVHLVPDQQIIDLVGQVVLVVAGQQIEDQLAHILLWEGAHQYLQRLVVYSGDTVGENKWNDVAQIVRIEFVYFEEDLLDEEGLEMADQ